MTMLTLSPFQQLEMQTNLVPLSVLKPSVNGIKRAPSKLGLSQNLRLLKKLSVRS